MKKIILAALFCLSLSAIAQVGINTTTPNAQLEIRSTNPLAPNNTDGLLIPRIDTFPAVNPTAAQKGMLVFLTNSFAGNPPGFYFWNSPGWVGLSNISNSWRLNGNAGINPATQFIGTTDNTNVVFRRNNVESGLLAQNNTAFGNNSYVGALGTDNTAIGALALRANIGTANTAVGTFAALNTTSGQYNTVVGSNALLSNTTGSSNTSVGAYASQNTTTGNSNTAIGLSAVSGNSTGSSNTGIGSFAVSNTTTGNSNTGLGNGALFTNATGSQNTALGRSADVATNNLTNATAIGANAQVAASNSLVLGSVNGVNGAISSVNVGIGTTTPLEELHVVGNIRMVDGNQGTGKILTSDANGTATWTTPAIASGTLDQAYDFGGAGVGKTITADAGAVLINGTDGLVSTGTAFSGAIVPSGEGTRMVWNPNKAAFRAGYVSSGFWDDVLVGGYSVATGYNTTASGSMATAFGNATRATGQMSTAFGFSNLADAHYATAFGNTNVATGQASTAFGNINIASGINATAFGSRNEASNESTTAFGNGNFATGYYSAAFGHKNTASTIGETVLGIGATTYIPSGLGYFKFGAGTQTDRLLTVGNAFDANNNDLVDVAERRDALVILKDGNTGIGSSTPQDKLHVVGNIRMVDGNQAAGKILTSDANGTATWATAGTIASGTLDQAYDFGGAGIGRTITADTGAVLINGTDGLVSTGTIGSGAIAPSGNGVRMLWNPRKAAFRAGTIASVTPTSWDDANIGSSSVAFGNNTTASGLHSAAFGNNTIASGIQSVAFGTGSSASAHCAVSIGLGTIASGDFSAAFGYNTEATNINSVAFGQHSVASGSISHAFGSNVTASGDGSIALGYYNTASGNYTTALGNRNTAASFGETVLGIGATNYTLSTNGATQFRSVNATDRFFVIGNAIDTNSNSLVDNAERRDAMVVLKNGNTGIGSSTPQDKLHVVGNIRMVDTNQAAGKVMTSDANGTATWQLASANAWGLIGNTGMNDTVNFIGTTNDADVVFKRNNTIAGRLDTSNTALGVNALIASVSGTDNTAVGVNAMNDNTDGDWNTAMGSLALGSNTLGNANAAFGYAALLNNTMGGNNVVFGANALFMNTMGTRNIAVGTSALYTNSTGVLNTVVGHLALNGNSTGNENVAVGTSAMVGNGIGNQNSTLGSRTLFNNDTGSLNTAMGFEALFDNTTGTNNTAIGQNALDNNTQGNYNTALGAGANVNSTIYTNATAIGSRALAGNSNTLILGSVNGVNGATSSVNVGIGTTNPNSRLEVVDENAVTTSTIEGNVNIVSNNVQAIDVGASLTLGGFTTDAGTASRTFGSIEGRKANATTGNASGYLIFKTNNGGTLCERMRITNAGDVGIGLANPGGQFQLSLDEGRKPGTNTWTIASDERLKNIHGHYSKGLEEISKLQPITYNYINVGKRTFEEAVLQTEFVGFSAQEVQKVFPEAVGTDDDGYLNFNMHSILVASVNALKELDAKNKTLQTQNAELKNQLETLQQQVNAIMTEVEKLKR